MNRLPTGPDSDQEVQTVLRAALRARAEQVTLADLSTRSVPVSADRSDGGAVIVPPAGPGFTRFGRRPAAALAAALAAAAVILGVSRLSPHDQRHTNPAQSSTTTSSETRTVPAPHHTSRPVGTSGTVSHPALVDATALSADGGVLASADVSGAVRIWDTATGTLTATLAAPVDGETLLALDLSPDGSALAVTTTRGVVLWKTTGHQITAAFPVCGAVTFSPDGRILACANDSVHLWDLTRPTFPETRLTGSTLIGNVESVSQLIISPDGRSLVAVGESEGVGIRDFELWNLATRTRIGALESPGSTYLRSLVFAPDGRTFATGEESGVVRLWDTAGHRVLATLTGHTGRLETLAFSLDGRVLATADDSGAVRLWDTVGHRALATLTGHSSLVTRLAFSPDGRTLTGLGDDAGGKAVVWDTATGRALVTLDRLTSGATDADRTTVALSTDGGTAAAFLDSGRTVWLWNLATSR